MSGADTQEIAVVVGVRDAAPVIDRTLLSVLAQRDVELECVVVDDGSRDDTAARVLAIARADPRVRLLRQGRCGLTRALIHGCAEARAPLIARIDAGDLMLPGRLRRQRDVLDARPDVDVLATATRLCGPEGEPLEPPPLEHPGRVRELTAEFASAHAARLTGVAHMSVCMRRDAYRAAGGYRSAFRLAQDVDLWARMAEAGGVARLEEVLTEVRVALDSLSPRFARTQLALRQVAAAAARVRRRDGDESALLERARAMSEQALDGGGRDGAAALFVAACLARNGATALARRYYRRALRDDPLSARALLGLTRTRLHEWLGSAGAAP